MELKKGRPEDFNKRLKKEQRVYEFLNSLNIEYMRVDHPEADTMELCYNIDAVLGASICKNLFLCNRQQTDFYLLMLPSDKPFKTKDLSAQIETSRLSFASAEFMEKYLDTTPGSVSVMGLMNDTENKVTLLVDEELLKEDYFGCHPCINTSSLKIGTTDLKDKIIPTLGNTVKWVRL
jgi:Ala-tRNA(Pro) deacylase